MKKIIVILLLLVSSTLTCYAESKEVITEGRYTMSDNDTPAQAEQIAILNAKKAALEEVGTLIVDTRNIDVGKLKTGQIKELSTEVIQSEILEKSKEYDGKNMVYWVKMKSIITTDNLAEAIAAVISATEKKIVAVMVNFDLTEPSNNDVAIGKLGLGVDKKKYKYANLEKDNNLLEPIKLKINEKYSNRNTVLEFVSDNPSDLATYAKEKSYDYLILSSLKFTRLEKSTTYAILCLSCDWKIEGACNLKIYDAGKQKEIFSRTYMSKVKEPFAPPSMWNLDATGYTRAFDSAITKLQNDIAGQIKETLPSL